MARSTLTYAGRQRSPLAAVDVTAALDLLADPARVTVLLGDLLDEDASTGGPTARWVVPAMHVGPMRFAVTLLPVFVRADDHVVVSARPEPGASAEGGVVLALRPESVGGRTVALDTDWQLELGLSLPRTVVRALRPSLSRSVHDVVARIQERTVAALDGLGA